MVLVPGRVAVFERIVRQRADRDAVEPGCRSRRRLDPRHARDTVVGR
jgi:hypothetical protein